MGARGDFVIVRRPGEVELNAVSGGTFSGARWLTGALLHTSGKAGFHCRTIQKKYNVNVVVELHQKTYLPKPFATPTIGEACVRV